MIQCRTNKSVSLFIFMPIQGRPSRGLGALNRTFKEQGQFSIRREHKNISKTINFYPIDIENKGGMHWGGITYILFLHLLTASILSTMEKTFMKWVNHEAKNKTIFIYIPNFGLTLIGIFILGLLVFMYTKNLKISSLQSSYVIIYSHSFLFPIMIISCMVKMLFYYMQIISGSLLGMLSLIEFILAMSLCGYLTVENVSPILSEHMRDRRSSFIVHFVLLIGQLVSLLVFIYLIYSGLWNVYNI